MLFVMNVIIFIIRVLKLLFMHAKYFFLAVVVLMAAISPAAGSLTKISAGAPVYIGEKDLNIAAGLQGCRAIAWWPDGSDTDAPPQKNVTIIKTLEDSDIAFSYTIDPAIYAGYTGPWYCENKKPLRIVFDVVQPQVSIRFWDLDNNEDVTGKTVPLNANITYRVDTNLDEALQYKYRPEVTPLDSFFTINLIDPSGMVLHNMYSGSYGKSDTLIVPFENHPFISVSPFFWKEGSAWDRTSRNIQGDFLYSVGTYAITVDQNLNHMQEMYTNAAVDDRTGVLNASATITFIKPESTPLQTVTATQTIPSGTVTTPAAGTPGSTPTYATLPGSRTTVPTKTTYAPLPFWLVLSSLGIAFASAPWLRR